MMLAFVRRPGSGRALVTLSSVASSLSPELKRQIRGNPNTADVLADQRYPLHQIAGRRPD